MFENFKKALQAEALNQKSYVSDEAKRRQMIDQILPLVMGVALPSTSAKIPTVKTVNTSALINRIKNLTSNQRSVMGAFGEGVERFGPRANLGQTGQKAQQVSEFLGINSASASNKKLLNFFNQILEYADKAGVKPANRVSQLEQFNIRKLL